jgi:hypothetical protein
LQPSNTRPALPEFSPDDEFGPNKTFPQLAPENLTRGCALVYLNPTDDEGLTRTDRELAERRARGQRGDELELQRLIDETFAAIEQDVLRDLDAAPPKPPPATVTARSAASALSRAPKAAGAAAFAAPPKSSGARAPLAVRKARAPVPQAGSAERQPPASTAASRSTLGYSRGRAVSQKVRRPGALVFRDGAAAATGRPDASRKPAGRSASEEQFQAKVREVVTELRAHGLRDEDDGMFGSVMPVDDDEYADFQLAL